MTSCFAKAYEWCIVYTSKITHLQYEKRQTLRPKIHINISINIHIQLGRLRIVVRTQMFNQSVTITYSMKTINSQ